MFLPDQWMRVPMSELSCLNEARSSTWLVFLMIQLSPNWRAGSPNLVDAQLHSGLCVPQINTSPLVLVLLCSRRTKRLAQILSSMSFPTAHNALDVPLWCRPLQITLSELHLLSPDPTFTSPKSTFCNFSRSGTLSNYLPGS